jgi:rfaE bifunctional protein kinase chain/domain
MTASEILAAFPALRVLVAGDVCLDRWCRYEPSLADPSRETGIPRVGVTATETTPGAAGTVANNVAALGAKVSVLGVVGADGFGYELDRALESRGIGRDLLVRSDRVCTFTYTKLINAQTGVEDLPRLDFVNTEPVPAAMDSELASRLESAAPDFDVILVSDQAETDAGGVVTAGMRAALARIAARFPRTVIWVDSRMRPELFRSVIVKGNRFEAAAASRRVLGRIDYRELRRVTESPLLVITRGSLGAMLIGPDLPTFVRAKRIENPVDICGAGDSFSAGAALALKASGDPIAAAKFGNLVASITIMKKGTGTASPEEILQADRAAQSVSRVETSTLK